MRPLEIVDFAPGVEGALRLGEVAEAAQREHLGIERAMEALVLTAALRMIGTAVNDADAELEQPYLEPRPVLPRRVSPGRAVVDEERIRQAVAAEGHLQPIAHGVAALIGASLQAKVIARMIVHHRQRMALRII